MFHIDKRGDLIVRSADGVLVGHVGRACVFLRRNVSEAAEDQIRELCREELGRHVGSFIRPGEGIGDY